MNGCGSCRRRPPEELCKICCEANDGCTGYCRDAFVYDQRNTDEEIANRLKEEYTIGAQGGGLEIGVKIPARILDLLSSS